jgi:hypothetical protein
MRSMRNIRAAAATDAARNPPRTRTAAPATAMSRAVSREPSPHRAREKNPTSPESGIIDDCTGCAKTFAREPGVDFDGIDKNGAG